MLSARERLVDRAGQRQLAVVRNPLGVRPDGVRVAPQRRPRLIERLNQDGELADRGLDHRQRLRDGGSVDAGPAQHTRLVAALVHDVRALGQHEEIGLGHVAPAQLDQAGTATGHPDDHHAGLANLTQHRHRVIGDGFITTNQGAVQIGGDETRKLGHGNLLCWPRPSADGSRPGGGSATIRRARQRGHAER